MSRAGKYPALAVADPAESEGSAGGVGAVGVNVRGVVLVVQGFGDRAGVDGAGEGSGMVVVKSDENGCREEVNRLAAEHQIFGVAQRKIPYEAGGYSDAVCADSRGDAVGVGKRDRVVERARAHGAGGDGVAVERGDQGELVAARGAVAVGECVGGLGKLVDALVLGLLAGSVLVELGKIRRVRHGPQGRT